MNLLYKNSKPYFSANESKSILHNFFIYGGKGLTINPYNGCQHRCGYCYATYERSPKFYDHIYAKINASKLLVQHIKSWKKAEINPVMIASATDAYQSAELKYSITKQCVEVLQSFKIPYYIFTKSIIIERDLELHKRYNENCFIVWSITTSNENLKRIIEPGTPTTKSVFQVIENFSKSGIKCVINIDPIIPFLTDSRSDITNILDTASDIGIKYISGAILRIRYDIWERIKYILQILNKDYLIPMYEKIFKFKDPITFKNNLVAENIYADSIMNTLKNEVHKRKMKFGFPYLNSKKIVSTKNNTDMVTLLDFIK